MNLRLCDAILPDLAHASQPSRLCDKVLFCNIGNVSIASLKLGCHASLLSIFFKSCIFLSIFSLAVFNSSLGSSATSISRQ